MNEEYAERIKKEVEKTKEIDEEIKEEVLSPVDLIESFFREDTEKEKDKIIEILFEHPDLRKISDVDKSNIVNITALLTYAKQVDSDLVNHFCETYLAIGLSKDRKSREEIVEIYKTHIFGDMGMFPQDTERRGRFQRLKDRMNI